jgi:hypothetical protein
VIAGLSPESFTDALQCGEQELVAEAPGRIARRGNDDEGGVGLGDCSGGVRRCMETTPVLVDQLLEARFIDRGLTRIDGSDESRVHVRADDPKALVREDGGKRCPELTEPNHRNLHLNARPPPPVES